MINFTLLPLALQSPVLPLRHPLAVSWKQNQINTAFIGLPPKKMFLDIQKESKRHITVSSRNSQVNEYVCVFDVDLATCYARLFGKAAVK